MSLAAAFLPSSVAGFLLSSAPGFLASSVAGFFASSVAGFLMSSAPGFLPSSVTGGLPLSVMGGFLSLEPAPTGGFFGSSFLVQPVDPRLSAATKPAQISSPSSFLMMTITSAQMVSVSRMPARNPYPMPHQTDAQEGANIPGIPGEAQLAMLNSQFAICFFSGGTGLSLSLLMFLSLSEPQPVSQSPRHAMRISAGSLHIAAPRARKEPVAVDDRLA